MTSSRTLARRLVPAALPAVAALVAAAAVVGDDTADTAFGLLTGGLVALVVAAVLVDRGQRRAGRLAAEHAVLDRLEPLRADDRDRGPR